jgi:ribosome-binding protein aMBF1 (putative translation factor)
MRSESTLEREAAQGQTQRRAPSVVKQRGKLTYVPPRLITVERVSPLGYQGVAPDRSKAIALRDVRTAKGLSVRQLARISRISASTIYRIERGDTSHRPHVAHVVSAALGVSPWEVIEFWPIMEGTALPD